MLIVFISMASSVDNLDDALSSGFDRLFIGDFRFLIDDAVNFCPGLFSYCRFVDGLGLLMPKIRLLE